MYGFTIDFQRFTGLRGTSPGAPQVTARASGALGILFRSNLFLIPRVEWNSRRHPGKARPRGRNSQAKAITAPFANPCACFCKPHRACWCLPQKRVVFWDGLPQTGAFTYMSCVPGYSWPNASQWIPGFAGKHENQWEFV